MKKLIVLALSLLFVFGGNAYAEMNFNLIFHDDFEAGNTNKWDTWDNFTSLETVDSISHTGNFAIHPVADISLLKKEFSPISTGVLVLTWYSYQVQLNAGDYLRIAFGPDFATRSNHEAEFGMDIQNNGINVAIWYEGAVFFGDKVLDISDMEWYKMTVKHDFSASKTTFLVNDNVVYEEDFDIPSIGYIWIGDASSGGNGGEDYYLDDVELYQYDSQICSTGDSITINSDLSFSLQNATYSNPLSGDMDLSVDFTFFGDQDGTLLWKLENVTVQ